MLEEVRARLEKVKEKLSELRGYLSVESKEARIKEIEAELTDPSFWSKEKKNDTIEELKSVKSVAELWRKLEADYKSIGELSTIVEPSETESIAHLKEELSSLEKKVDSLEFKSLLNDPADKANAIISINSGAGGTEACDWANMLFRMYSKWADKRTYKIQTLDVLPGEEAGVKNVTAIIRGSFAFGYLKTENGVHRLVRISPFDSNKRRHTSFASVDVIPEISDDIKVDLSEKDLRIDTYRAGGKGGQHVNVTDSAVRITHIPTGTVVQCQNERSQYKNKAMAMKILKARIYESERRKKLEELTRHYEDKQKIEWGSQIRSYVMHPYSMVKDHRTNHQTSNVQVVMDGGIDEFIGAYLKSKLKR